MIALRNCSATITSCTQNCSRRSRTCTKTSEDLCALVDHSPQSFWLNEWLSALKLSTLHASIAQWCEEQGAVAVAEIVENREDLVQALSKTLTVKQRAILLSEDAVQQASIASLRTQVQGLQALLSKVGGHLPRTNSPSWCGGA